tara:strand:- start:847 stop:1041 length:195 start_codon:yes stop_codon:yes gene_type:complete
MTFDEAVKKSIKNFLKGKMPMETGSLTEGGLFYTPEYFDDLEQQFLDDPIKTKKSKNKEPKNEA